MVSRSFVVAYHSRCTLCGEKIYPSEQGRFVGPNQIAHASCARREDDDPFEHPDPVVKASRKIEPDVCPQCFITHAGECF